jgi:Holliday junction resolvase RusA-like endonuclease
VISFVVDGIPAPKGSFRVSMGRGRTRKGKQRMVVRSDSPRTDAWEAAVRLTAQFVMRGRAPLTGAVDVRVVFFMPRPRSVKRLRHTVKPDPDKLLRSTLDALTGVVYGDDAQAVTGSWDKRYADGVKPGASIQVTEVLDGA